MWPDVAMVVDGYDAYYGVGEGDGFVILVVLLMMDTIIVMVVVVLLLLPLLLLPILPYSDCDSVDNSTM